MHVRWLLLTIFFVTSAACYAEDLAPNGALDKAITDSNLAAFNAAIQSGAQLKRPTKLGKPIDSKDMLLAKAIDRRAEVFRSFSRDEGASTNPRYQGLLTDGLAIVTALLEAGIDPNQKDWNARPAVNMAVERGDVELVQLLMKHGAKLRDGDRPNLVTAAAYLPSAAMFEFLLTCGFEPAQRSNSEVSTLAIAAANEKSNLLEVMLKAGVSPNPGKKAGHENEPLNEPTALHAAAKAGMLEHVKLLLKYGAELDAQYVAGSRWVTIGGSANGGGRVAPKATETLLGKTALWEAVGAYRYDVAEYLLSVGARVDIADERGQTPLHIAAEHGADAAHPAEGSVPIIRLLVQKGANVNARTLKDPNSTRPWNETPLHYAVHYDNAQNVAALLDLGADINAVDSEGRTALYRALTGRNLKCADVLRKRGAVESAVNPKINETIAVAGRSAAFPELQALLKADPSLARAADPDTLVTPLHTAAKEGNVEGIKLLLANEADVNARDKRNRSPLDEAFNSGLNTDETLMLLVKSGADVKTPLIVQGRIQSTPLLRLFDRARGDPPDPKMFEELVRLFLEHGADPNLALNNQDTPMKRAIELNGASFARIEMNVLPLLIKHGGDVNARHNDRTALMATARNLDVDTMALLMVRGSDVNAKDDLGRTALHWAVKCDVCWDRNGNPDCKGDDRLKAVKLLHARGANLNDRDNFGWTALDFAEYARCTIVVTWLKEQNATQSNFPSDALAFLRAVEKTDTVEVDRILTAHPELTKVWDTSERPPIFRATFFGGAPLMKVLLSHGSDPNLEGTPQKTLFIGKGRTPLVAAIEQNNIEAVKLLVEFKADVNKPLANGQTPLDYAKFRAPDIAEFLAEQGAKHEAPRTPKPNTAVKPPRPPNEDF